MNRGKRTVTVFVVLILLTAGVFVASLAAGGSRLGIGEVLQALRNPDLQGTAQMIVWQIRIPRIILGMVVGAGLAVCGTTFQGMLRNPLADPFTLGISGGAALGATIGIILLSSGIWVSVFAFAGALFSVLMVYLTAGKKHFTATALILGGVVLSFVFSSLVMFILSVSKSEEVHTAVLWLMGDLSAVGGDLVKIAAGSVALGIAVLLVLSRELNILTLGEEKAVYLGLEVETVKKILFVTASLITGACVAVSGIIGFVGLVVPHLLRRFTGPDHRVLIPASVIGGALFLMLCDSLARTLLAPVELPVGVITGMFGGVFFLVIFIRSKRWEVF